MSRGSYFTLYRKRKNDKVSAEIIETLKNEYFEFNKKSFFNDNQDNEMLKMDIPLLMHSTFKAKCIEIDELNKESKLYYDIDGISYDKLLDFHFCSSFGCLIDRFRLDPYHFKNNSIFISKDEASKMLQAIEYVLSEDYSKKFESILNNEYVEIFGDGYSMFDDRFKKSSNPVYIDQDDTGYVMTFNDSGLDREVEECDNDIRFNLNRAKACLQAYLNAEEYAYDGEELVLEYSTYG